MKNVTYINAGAGSGKTFTLTRILSEKLAEKNGDGNSLIKPSQVILTTFTELAAAEFREKARQKLLEAGNLDAAAQIDSAAIGTVHSVALRFIKKFWYLLGYGAEIQTINERDEDFYMNQSLARIVRERDDNGVLKKQKELEAFRKFRDYYDISDAYSHPDFLFWQRHLRDIVEKMEYYDVNDVDESISRSLENVRSIYVAPPVNYDFVAKALEEYCAFCRSKSKKSGDKADKHEKIGTKLLSQKRDRNWLNEVNSLIKDPCSPGALAKECVHFTALKETLEKSSISKADLDIMEPFIQAIFHLAKEWRDDYVAYKKRNHIISYNDMERLFLHLITKEKEVQDYIRENYRLVMVDEFQDSNPIQLKIFNCLSELIAGTDGHSFWVGDPKQAIYGFRGADTDLVNSVSKHFHFYNDADFHGEEGPDRLGSGRLVESWRSRPSLVNLVNSVFADKFKDEIDPLCITLSPHFKDNQLNYDSIVHWNNPKKGNQQKTKPEAIAWRVKELLDSKMLVHSGTLDEPLTMIRPKDIAILCRRNDTIKDIVKAMRKFDIPVSESEDAIMQRIEVQLVVVLLQFVQNPDSKHVIADLMRMLWGKTTVDILRERIDYVLSIINGNDDKEFDASKDNWKEDDHEVALLRDMADRFKHLSVPEIVRGLIYECNLPALVAKWGDSIIRNQNLSTVQHLADDYDQMCVQMGLGSSINGFIYYLNSIEPDKERDNQSDTVKVFTYHGAKGLEWPVVILNELNTDSLDSSELIKKQFMRVREMVLHDNASSDDPFAKEYYLHFFPNIIKGANAKPADPMVDKIKELDIYDSLEKRTRGEETRLLYVGMTRAKDCIISLGIDNRFAWLANIGIDTPDKNHIWGIPDCENHLEEINVPSEDAVKATQPEYTIVNKPQTHSVYGTRYLSPSKLEEFDGFNAHTKWLEHGISIDTKGWGSDYATIGSCIHDIFAAYQKGKDELNHQVAISVINGYGVANQLAGHIDAIIRSADWLYDTLQSKFPQQDGDKVEQELPFMMTLRDGRTLRGEMDLLWHYTDEAGQHCVLVDYKTFQGVKLDEHTKSYYPQLSAYVAALKDAGFDVTHAIIFYPVYSIVHELS